MECQESYFEQLRSISTELKMNDINYMPFWGMPSIKNKFSAITLELINYCANNCIFCCAQDGSRVRRIMSKKDIMCILNRFGDYSGGATLSDTGDPIILPDLPEKVGLIKEYWPKCHLNMNSTLSIPRDSSYFKSLFDNKLNQIMLSLYVFDKVAYEKYQGSKNFDIVINNLRKISELGPEYAQKVILKKMANFGDLYHIDDYDKKQADFDIFLDDMGFSRSYKSIIIPIESDNKNTKRYNSPIPCSVLWGSMSGRAEIHANLDIVPCCLYPNEKVSFGNLRESTLEDIFYGDKAQEFRAKWWNMEIDTIPVCRRCKFYGTKVNSMEEFTGITAWIADKLKGHKVIYWGNGEAFRRYAPFFRGVNPVGIIADEENSYSYGLPKIDPDMLGENEYQHLPLVIFKYVQHIPEILTLLDNKYQKSVSEIYTIPPSYLYYGKNGIAYYDVT